MRYQLVLDMLVRQGASLGILGLPPQESLDTAPLQTTPENLLQQGWQPKVAEWLSETLQPLESIQASSRMGSLVRLSLRA